MDVNAATTSELRDPWTGLLTDDRDVVLEHRRRIRTLARAHGFANPELYANGDGAPGVCVDVRDAPDRDLTAFAAAVQRLVPVVVDVVASDTFPLSTPPGSLAL